MKVVRAILQLAKEIGIAPKNADEPVHWTFKVWFCFMALYGAFIFFHAWKAYHSLNIPR